jgi:hypothetical protein
VASATTTPSGSRSQSSPGPSAGGRSSDGTLRP